MGLYVWRSQALIALTGLLASVLLVAGPPPAVADPVVILHQADFDHGTYIIDQPGNYRLGEDISFNPNSPAALDAAIGSGAIPPAVAAGLDLSIPVDAYRSGWPLATQFLHEPADPFIPGGLLEPRYDPSAYGVGFFAAIAIEADDVVLDLDGHTIEQSAEHALLQRFFAVIELNDQPFLPGQGPSGFGDEVVAASNVTIKNGTIGRSAHHGIHGNGNEHIRIRNVDFDGYEVAAVALNGVDGLDIRNSEATNRKDVPVVGTFSSARFISGYVDQLVRDGSPTTLTVEGVTLTAADVQSQLRLSINAVHADVIDAGLGFIDPVAHPDEYALYHNRFGVVDGNSYSFLVNGLGVAVDGFPLHPAGPDARPSRNVRLTNVHVRDQESFINEVPALDAGSIDGPEGAAVIDPVGAVFQVLNTHPDTGVPVTVSTLDPATASYTGNALANAQALVAKANEGGEFDSTPLDTSRMKINSILLSWVEGEPGSNDLGDIGAAFFCNGDSMFHVDKGAIAFKMDAASRVRLVNTQVDGLVNLGAAGSLVCGDDFETLSHPLATLPGYGGAAVRGYSFAGSHNVIAVRATASGLHSHNGSAVGFDVFTDSDRVRLVRTSVDGVVAGSDPSGPAGGPNGPANAAGVHIGSDASRVRIVRATTSGLEGRDAECAVLDQRESPSCRN